MHENCQPVNHPGSVHSGKGSSCGFLSCICLQCHMYEQKIGQRNAKIGYDI